MQPGELISITNGKQTKAIQIEMVLRGRVLVKIPAVGSVEVDLRDGSVKPLPPPRGVCAVDIGTGRVIGTSARVSARDLLRLEALEVGEIIALDNSATAEVYDVLLSEGTVKIYVPHSDQLTRRAQQQSGVWLVGWKVCDRTLAALRESAGVTRVA